MLAPEGQKARKDRCTIVYPDTTRAQRAEWKALAKFTRTYKDTITKQTTMAEGSGHRQPGPYFYTQNGKTYASLPLKMLQGVAISVNTFGIFYRIELCVFRNVYRVKMTFSQSKN